MLSPLPALTLGLGLAFPVAESVPQFDVNPTCNAAARSGAQLQPNKDGCMRSELGAKNQVTERWREFPSGDRASCTELTTTSPSKSYVQLLTCLELALEVRKLRGVQERDRPTR